MTGPCETPRQAPEASTWQTHGRAEGMSITQANMADLAAACAGIDKHIIGSLAGWEPATVAVVCRLIERARAAGQVGAQ
jgi:hypothetical protein